MRRFALICLAALPPLLIACGSAEQVPENGDLDTQPMEISSELYPAAGKTGAAFSDRSAEDAWSYDAASRTAVFGPPASETVLEIACRDPARNELAVLRHVPAALGAKGVLSFAGNNRTASVAVVSEPAAEGAANIWQGDVSTDLAELRQVFAGESGTVAVELSTGAELIVPASDAPLRAIDACAPA